MLHIYFETAFVTASCSSQACLWLTASTTEVNWKFQSAKYKIKINLFALARIRITQVIIFRLVMNRSQLSDLHLFLL